MSNGKYVTREKNDRVYWVEDDLQEPTVPLSGDGICFIFQLHGDYVRILKHGDQFTLKREWKHMCQVSASAPKFRVVYGAEEANRVLREPDLLWKEYHETLALESATKPTTIRALLKKRDALEDHLKWKIIDLEVWIAKALDPRLEEQQHYNALDDEGRDRALEAKAKQNARDKKHGCTPRPAQGSLGPHVLIPDHSLKLVWFSWYDSASNFCIQSINADHHPLPDETFHNADLTTKIQVLPYMEELVEILLDWGTLEQQVSQLEEGVQQIENILKNRVGTADGKEPSDEQ